MPDTILTTNNLQIGYQTGKSKQKIIQPNINVSVKKGELVALIGSNGIGKSTLLRTLAGLQAPLTGEVLIDSRNIIDFPKPALAHKLSFVSTEIIHVPVLSVFDLVALGRYPHTNWAGRLKKADKKMVWKSLKAVGMENFAEKNINEISDGERQRAMIARTLAQNTGLVVLDEPTAFLDIANKYEIVRILKHMARKVNKSIIFSSHDLSIVLKEADKIWLMLPGAIEQGSPEDLVINGSFNRIFPNSELVFDAESGDFKSTESFIGEIDVQGNDNMTDWTKKAMLRIGYKINKNAFLKLKLFPEQKKWKLQSGNQEKEFSSIYDLTTFLIWK